MSHSVRTRSTLLLATALCALSASASAQQGTEGTVFRAGAAEVEIGGQVQMQFNTTTVDAEPTTEWLLRRVRLEAKVRINDLVSGKIQPDFAGNRVVIKDAYLLLTFAPGLEVLAGKAFRPFSVLEQTSSKRILPIERGLDIRGVDGLDEYALIHDLEYSDRQIGLQVQGAPRGAPLAFTYAAGVFQSPVQGRTGSENSQQFAARGTISPVAPLRLGFGWSRRDFALASPADATNPELRAGNAYEADLEYGSFAPGVHLLAETTWGDFDPFSGADFFGAQGWLAYRTPALSASIANLEPVLRVSYGDLRDEPSPSERGGTLITPGLNVYLGGLNRVMLNYDVWAPGRDRDTQGSFKAMFQLAF